NHLDCSAAADLHVFLRLASAAIFHYRAASSRSDGNRRGRAAMDVEDPTPGGESRDQRTARAGRADHQADDDVAGCHSRFLSARVSHQAGRFARALHGPVVQGRQDRVLPPVLFGILRHVARADDRENRGDEPGRLPALAGKWRTRPDDGAIGGTAVPRTWVQRLPYGIDRCAGAAVAGRFWQTGAVEQRRRGDGGRGIYTRFDTAAGQADCGRIHQRHAFLFRASHRGAGNGTHRLHQEPREPITDRNPMNATLPQTETEFTRTRGRVPSYFEEGGRTVGSWLLTTDHKRIGILYLYSILFYFTIAAIAAAIIRLELITPQGDLVSAETYNKLFTIHGTLMVWFFLIPSIPSVLGNFVIPLMIGAKDLAFPRLNLLSWYLFNIGGLIALYAVAIGGVDTGWTFYTPYSSAFTNSHVVTMVAGVFIA